MTVLENVLVYAHAQPGERLARVFATPTRVIAAEHRARERALALLESVELAHLAAARRSEEHTSELQSQSNLVCRLLLEKKTACDRPASVVVRPAAVIRVDRQRDTPRRAHRC